VQVLRAQFRNGEPASPLRHATRDALVRDLPGCDDDVVEDALVVISELVQNVSQHTSSDGELVVSVAGGDVLIEVHDDDPQLPRPRQPDEHRIGGRGLLLVGRMAETWGVRTRGTGKTVWALLPTAVSGSTLASA
jgi:anti-sigma regulatory factor (Ser/Thr protein kinase)